MFNRKSKIVPALLTAFTLYILITITASPRAVSLRILLTDYASIPLKLFQTLSQQPKKLIPFASFREENASLRKKIDYLTSTLAGARLLVDENRRLRALLDFKATVPYTTVAAQVIGRDPSNWSNSLIVDKGSGGGVRRNRAVLSLKGLVGRTVEVGRRSSKIVLITDPNSRVGVLIQKNRQGGVLVGSPDGRCKMVYLAMDSGVAAGDRVITAGFGSVFPKDILVGKVVKVGKDPGRLYQYAIVKPAEDLSKVEEVLCLQ